MAKVNTIGIIGAALSLVGAGTFWMYALLSGSVISSGSDSFTRDMQSLMIVLAVVYMTAALFGLLSQLGGLIQLPSTLIGLPIAWYLGYNAVMYIFYFIGFLGTSMLIIAMFLEHSHSEKMFKAPPFSRIRIWSAAASGARPLSKGTAKKLLVVLVASPVLVAAFATYAWGSDVSTMRISVLINGVMCGSTNISISVDGEVVLTSFIEYDPTLDQSLFVITTHEVCAGTHIVEADAWNGDQLTEGSVDTSATENVLPFTTERTRLMIGFGSI